MVTTASHERLRPVGATVRWHERSVKRYYDDDPRTEKGGDGKFDLAVSVSVSPVEGQGDDEAKPAITIREGITIELGQGTVTVDAAVRFFFHKGADLSDEHVVDQFVRDTGTEYVAGILRGALLDLPQSIGMEPALLPIIEAEMHPPTKNGTADESKSGH